MRERKGVYRGWRWNEGKRGRIFKEQDGAFWQAEWYTGRGERHRRSTYTQDEAEAWWELARYQSESSVRSGGSKPFTLADAAVSAGRVQQHRGNSKSWRDRCARIVEQHLYRLIGPGFDLNNENLAKMADDYIEARSQERGPSGKPITKNCIRKELLIIQQGCRRARDYGEFTGALALIVPESLNPENTGEGNVGVALTEAMYLRLLQVATVWRRPWIVFARNTGIDIGPTHRIRKDEIMWDFGEFGAVPVRDYKTQYRPRTVPLNHDARMAVDQRMEEPGEFLFEPVWSSNAFRECMKRWCPKAGIPKRIRWKDLSRHTFVSSLGNHGAPQSHVGALVGTSSKTRTVEKVYQHLELPALAKTVALIPSAFGPSKVRQNAPDTTAISREKEAHPLGADIEKVAEIAG